MGLQKKHWKQILVGFGCFFPSVELSQCWRSEHTNTAVWWNFHQDNFQFLLLQCTGENLWRRELRHEVVFGAEAAQGTQLPFPPELLCVLAKATNFYIAIHVLCFSFLGGRGSCPRHVTAIWGAFLILNMCFGEVMMITGLCCSSWHCNWRHSSNFIATTVPLLLVSFKHFSCFQELLHTGGYHGPE